MKAYLITFRSITYAQRGEQAMKKEGVRCNLRRTPRWMEERGCGYAVEAKLADITLGTQILRREGIPYRKVYSLTGDGAVEEEKV